MTRTRWTRRTPRTPDQVLAAIRNVGERGLRIVDVAEILNMATPDARKAVRGLEDQGWLVRRTDTTGTHWVYRGPRI